MPTPPWTDDHSRLVARAAPEVPDVTLDELDRVWAVVRGSMAGPDRHRRRRRAVVGGALAAALLAGGGVATADVLTAHTGRYPADAEDLRLGGPGERLDPAAPDYGEVVAELTADVPFPSDAAREIARENEVEDGQRDAPGSASVATGALRFWVARAAVCAWGNAWAAGDGSERARTMLEEATDWPAVTDLDPDQVIRYRDGFADNTEAGYFPLLRDAARAGDLAALGRVLGRWGACDPALVPDLPKAILPGMPRS